MRRSRKSSINIGYAARGPLLRRRWALIGLLLLLLLPLLGVAHAQAPDLPTPGPEPAGEQEPITPVPSPPAADPRKLALGARLFEDPRLSHDSTRTCLSCHDVGTNGAQTGPRNARSSGPGGAGGSDRPLDTLTVFNAALSFRLSWEGRFRTLEAQAEASLESPTAMQTSVQEVIAKLTADPDMTRKFFDAYAHAPDRESLLNALATYERSLLTPGSRFDRWLGGDAGALTAEERNGYQIFKSLGCISCHQGVNVGGNLFERHGIFHPLASPKPEVLRVPSLRNVAMTAPYFHDGSAATLGEAVRRMGIAQLNWTLSDQQVEAIVAFLGALTGSYQGRPIRTAP
jgi:cytochrome c peroxidase